MVLVEEAKAGGTPRLGCPREDQDIRLLAGVAKPSSVTVCEDSLGLPCVGGTLSSSDIAGRLLPVVPAGILFPVGPVDSPVLSVGEPPSVPSRISVVLVVEAKAEGTPCLECPREDQDMRLLAAGQSWIAMCWGTMSSSDIAGRLLPVVPAGISFLVGPMDPAGPNGPYDAGGPVGPYGTLSPSDSDPADRMLQVALLARMGHCPHLTLLACMLQGALLAQMGRCPCFSLARLARMLQVACMGRCPHLNLILLARMLQVALLARLGHCPHLTPVLRYWWTLVRYSLFLTLHVGVRYLRARKDRHRVRVF